MERDILIPSRLYVDLMKYGFHGQNESGAWLLFSKSAIERDTWSKKSRQRYILRKIIPLEGEDIISSSPAHLTINTASFIPVLKEANNGIFSGFLHGHPSGFRQFSETDDDNESALLKVAKNRNGKDSVLISLLVLPDGTVLARCWYDNFKCCMCKVLITGNTVRCFHSKLDAIEDKSLFDRQIRLFGNSFTKTLQNLNVLIVGAGGTGSPLAVMLARSGVKNIAIIDPDVIDSTNIHRLYGVNLSDVGKSKAITLARYIKSMGFDTTTVGIHDNILQKEYQDLLRSSDVIFTATDDHAGRMLLNRFAYYYETPVIDLGLATVKSEDGKIQDITGRVTVLFPGSTCLLCRGIINSVRAREEELMRLNPDSYDDQVKEGYILGGGEPEPAFIAMTTSVATMAVEEFTQLICKFHKKNIDSTQRFRRFHIPEDRSVDSHPKSDCQICGTSTNWGIGDITPFLDRIA